MAERTNDGGPAFPVECHFDSKGDVVQGLQTGNTAGWHEGMTLRDYFAAMALGRHTGGYLIGYEDHAPEHRAELIRRLTRDCWEIADAMLAERQKRISAEKGASNG